MDARICEKCEAEGCTSCDDGLVVTADSCPALHLVGRRRFESQAPAPKVQGQPNGWHLLYLADERWYILKASFWYGNQVVMNEWYARGVAAGFSQLRPRPHLLLVDRGRVVDEWPAITRPTYADPAKQCKHPVHQDPALETWRLAVLSDLKKYDEKRSAGLKQDRLALEAVERLLFELADLRAAAATEGR